MWVCRAGKKAKYIDYFLDNSRIYIPWIGFNTDLSQIKDKQEFRELVSREMKTDNRTSISNWTGQLLSFYHDMSIGDYVIIPHALSHEYTLARISGEYEYDGLNELGLYHSRQVEIIKCVPRDVFTQSMQYSLGAYRTIFQAKDEEMLLSRIESFEG